jgi:50S ribosomal protein L16 3-hydroxylase
VFAQAAHVDLNATALTLPPGIDRETFLRDYWQKRPLLMRAALPDACFPLGADELAGLACESEFESRLILQHDASTWELRHGPFVEEDFGALPESHWTLLVQDVDKYLPEVAELIEAFDFVPTWRIDDIMISYASDQGGVGPHTDAYDVFLMQAVGRRRWRLSYRKYADDDLIPGLEQRILSHFDSDEDWVLEPGDVLYLPPGIAHWGTAEGECMTYSLGFRSPSQQEIASDWFQHLVALTSQRRLDDPQDLSPDSLAELTAGGFANAARLIDALPTTGSREFRIWLGRYLTEPKPQFHILPPDEPWDDAALLSWLANGRALVRHPFARLVWASTGTTEVAIFYQGEERLLPASLTAGVRLLAERRRLSAGDLGGMLDNSPETRALVVELLNEGVLEADGDDR